MKVTWDPAKREKALAERGLDFADATQVFDGRYVTDEDMRWDYGETRYISAGFLHETMVVIV